MRRPAFRGLLLAGAAVLLSFPLWGAACGDDCDGDSCAGSGGAGATQSTGGAGGGASLAEQYCICVLTGCHDTYHAKFGPESDEAAAEAACLAEGESLPLAGMDVSQGNFLECRMHYCELGHDDPSVCPNTVGEGACSDGGMGGSAGSGGGGGAGGSGGAGGAGGMGAGGN